MADRLTAAELAAYDAETNDLIDLALRTLADAEAEHETVSAEKADAKKAVDAANEELKALLHGRRAGRGKPPQRNLLSVVDPAWRRKSVVAIKEHVSEPVYHACLAHAENVGDIHHAVVLAEASGIRPPWLTVEETAQAADAVRLVVAQAMEGANDPDAEGEIE
jgi:hypothetical protein